jgi:hypothetical protein
MTPRTKVLTATGVVALALQCVGQPPPVPLSVPVPDPTNATVTLRWDASPDPVRGYTLHTGTNSRSYMRTNWAGTNLTATVTNLAIGGRYYFAATATGTNNLVSDWSNEVVYTVPVPPTPPVAVGVVRLPKVTLILEGSDGLTNWTTLAEVPLVIRSDKPHGAFRVRAKVETVEGVDW